MSKKTTIAKDGDNILLEIEDLTGCCFEVWDIEGKQNSVVKVSISLKSWKEIVNKWNNIKTKHK